MTPTTTRQQEILDFLVEFEREQGCTPSIPEIQRAFGIRSPNGVAGHLKALAKKGWIRRADRGSRTVELLGPGQARRGPLYDLPIYGAIPAGRPGEDGQESPERSVSIDEATLGFRPPAGSYVLRVRGDSMEGAGILDGDLVVIQPQRDPRPGQIVAALVDGQTTLKRLVRSNGKVLLRAENSKYAPITPRTSLEIQGVARALIRTL